MYWYHFEIGHPKQEYLRPLFDHQRNNVTICNILIGLEKSWVPFYSPFVCEARGMNKMCITHWNVRAWMRKVHSHFSKDIFYNQCLPVVHSCFRPWAYNSDQHQFISFTSIILTYFRKSWTILWIQSEDPTSVYPWMINFVSFAASKPDWRMESGSEVTSLPSRFWRVKRTNSTWSLWSGCGVARHIFSSSSCLSSEKNHHP